MSKQQEGLLENFFKTAEKIDHLFYHQSGIFLNFTTMSDSIPISTSALLPLFTTELFPYDYEKFCDIKYYKTNIYFPYIT